MIYRPYFFSFASSMHYLWSDQVTSERTCGGVNDLLTTEWQWYFCPSLLRSLYIWDVNHPQMLTSWRHDVVTSSIPFSLSTWRFLPGFRSPRNLGQFTTTLKYQCIWYLNITRLYKLYSLTFFCRRIFK